ncbi:MAG: ACP S-malonyltransferase [Lysobacterales bacterium]
MIRNDLAMLFPGQGSQSLGMLAALSQAHPQVRATFDEASAAIDLDLWALSQEGPEAELNRTINTQPALLAAGVAVWRAWMAAGGAEPAAMAGHSLGEYTALVCAGSLSLADGTRLVRERGRLMQEAVPEGVGAMAAVLNADLDLLAEICAAVSTETEPVVPANLNAPGQIVLSGAAAALDRALTLLAERGVKRAIRLPVSVPSHSPLMRGAAAQLGAYLAGVDLQPPRIPVIHNADVSSHGDADAIRAALVLQLSAPVRWIETVQKLVTDGATRALECGPGKVLTGMAKRIAPDLQMQAIADPAVLAATLAEMQS